MIETHTLSRNGDTLMIRTLFAALFVRDDAEALAAFHRAELREAGVTDAAFRDFLAGR